MFCLTWSLWLEVDRAKRFELTTWPGSVSLAVNADADRRLDQAANHKRWCAASACTSHRNPADCHNFSAVASRRSGTGVARLGDGIERAVVTDRKVISGLGTGTSAPLRWRIKCCEPGRVRPWGWRSGELSPL